MRGITMLAPLLLTAAMTLSCFVQPASRKEPARSEVRAVIEIKSIKALEDYLELCLCATPDLREKVLSGQYGLVLGGASVDNNTVDCFLGRDNEARFEFESAQYLKITEDGKIFQDVRRREEYGPVADWRLLHDTGIRCSGFGKVSLANAELYVVHLPSKTPPPKVGAPKPEAAKP